MSFVVIDHVDSEGRVKLSCGIFYFFKRAPARRVIVWLRGV